MKASATNVFCPPESCSSDFISLCSPVKETWGRGGGGALFTQSLHTACVWWWAGSWPTCMATPSYVSAMFSTREVPLALLSESCRDGLAGWT